MSGLNIEVKDGQFDQSTRVDEFDIVIQTPDNFVIEDNEVQEVPVTINNNRNIQTTNNQFLLFNANIQSLLNSSIDEELSTRLQELNTSIVSYINTVNTFREQANTFATGQVAALRQEVNTSVATLTQQNNTRALETSANAQDITAVNARVDNIETGNNANAGAITALTTRVETAETNIGDINTNLGTATTNIANLQTGLSTANNNIGTLQTGLSTANSNIGTLQTDVTNAEGDINTLQTDVNNAEDDIDNLQTLTMTHSSQITTLTTNVTQNGNDISGVTTNLNTLDTRVSDTFQQIASNYGYVSTVRVNNFDYVTGFQLLSGVTQTGPTVVAQSVFRVRADDFELVDPDTNNRVRMDENGIFFERGTGEVTRYLQFIRNFLNHSNNTSITLTDVQRVPSILISPGEMPTYRADFANQDQSFRFTIENVIDDIANSNTYTFTPRAELRLSDAVFNEELTGEVTNVSNAEVFSDAYTTTTALNGITLNYDVQSTRSHPSVANRWFFRRVTVQIQINGTSVGTANIHNFGASLGVISTGISHTANIPVGSQIRLRFFYEDAGGTFDTGPSGHYENRVLNTTASSSLSGISFRTQLPAEGSGINVQALTPSGGEFLSFTFSLQSTNYCSVGTHSTTSDSTSISTTFDSTNPTAFCTTFSVTYAIVLNYRVFIPDTTTGVTQNSNANITLVASASEGQLLAEGTLNITVVE